VLHLPAPWFQDAGNRLALLVEGVEYGEEAEVTDLLVQERLEEQLSDEVQPRRAA
jgi:hypothetical protein